MICLVIVLAFVLTGAWMALLKWLVDRDLAKRFR
jgi:hypothetical protein